ncbi:cilia- and flagella-associated protein 45 [Odontomachus brunneus]|uniref:cilia- and flagella-associated protein 45 n=1 Tax=Odontomachus brunneus TaxID=486640 RepID=UPI0013F1DE8A|nr:cilia- and flagella-associated protein 45 [Odontomachus brunneus]
MSKTMVRKTKSGNFEYRGDSKFPAGVYTIHPPPVCDHTLGGRPIHLRRSSAYEGKEIGKIRDKSGARKYLIPSKKPMVYPKIMTKEEYELLKERNRVVTKEERQAAAEAAEKEKERLIKESMERSEAMRQMDLKKSCDKDPKTREIEEEARQRTMHILDRAQNMRLEQEEEIQKCNRFILETKCRAIRDAQIAEKKLIEREILEEEKRLNNMMEDERRWAVKEELRKEQEDVAKRLQFAKFLKEQIEENEQQRILGLEKKQEESRLINLNNIAWQQDENEKQRKKEAENARVRQELTEVYEQMRHYKAMEQEENRIIDLRIQDYFRQKKEKEAKKAEEQRLDNLRKEREKTRIATQRVHTQDVQAHIDEINVARVREEVEREWRRKEKEEALRRLEAQKILQKERIEQINNKRIIQAIEIERDKREFERIARMQQAALCKEKEKLERKQQQALVLRGEILKQMNEKERKRIAERQRMFKEGLAIRAEIEARKKKLQDVMERKCQEMRENNVPDTYINEVKRMMENIQ